VSHKWIEHPDPDEDNSLVCIRCNWCLTGRQWGMSIGESRSGIGGTLYCFKTGKTDLKEMRECAKVPSCDEVMVIRIMHE